jgi:hypothetical protein
MGWQTYCVLQPDETQEMCGKTIKLVKWAKTVFLAKRIIFVKEMFQLNQNS